MDANKFSHPSICASCEKTTQGTEGYEILCFYLVAESGLTNSQFLDGMSIQHSLTAALTHTHSPPLVVPPGCVFFEFAKFRFANIKSWDQGKLTHT